MNRKKLALLAGIVLLTAALFFLFSRYTLIGFRFYPRNVQLLDLRGQDLSPEDYEKLHKKAPDTDILWDVPFQGELLSNRLQALSVTSLTLEEAQRLALCLPELQTLNGEDCRDYDALLAFKSLRPEVRVSYQVPLNGSQYPDTALGLTLSGITAQELELLAYLPQVRTITVTGGEPEPLMALGDYCQEKGISLQLQLGERILFPDTRTLEVSGITNDMVSLLYLLPKLEQLHLPEPEADIDRLLALEAHSGAVLTWEKTVLGLTFTRDAKNIDLTQVMALGYNQRPGARTVYQMGLEYAIQHTKEEVRSAVKVVDGHSLPDKTADTAALIEEVETAMAYFPQAESLVMCGCYLDNEAMAQFRSRHREDYKVAWSVDCGKIAPRTDASFFMPVKYHVYYLSTAEAYNLRYCEDMVAVDIGHMNVSDISFVECMPKLQYLILAHTGVQSIEPLRSCKNLKFLEVDHTGVRDLSPLLECTALEDLNIGKTWCSTAPLAEMTWLKNLWMIFRQQSARELAPFLPNTNIVSAGTATVDSGWRDLPNYYAMRDELKMFYMSW